MSDVMPEGEAIRLFTVPITDSLACEAASILARFRELADGALRVSDQEAFDRNTGSPYRQECAEIEALDEPLRGERSSLHAMLMETADLTKDNAFDHVRALEHDILMQPPPVWSPLTLSRVVMEGVLFSEYLLDPAISLNKRFARVAGVWVTDARYAQKQGEANGATPDDAGGMLQYAEDALRRCQAAERFNDRGRLVGYSFDGESAPMDINITERANRVMPRWLPTPYRLTSGAAHNRPWMIGRARDLSGNYDLVGEAATVMAAVMVSLGSIETVVGLFGTYFGVDMSTTLEQMEEERVTFLYRSIAIAHAQ
ncbi:hypothetical protein ACIRPQ_02250 [Streptomyces sp. NPDC101213]|uniref:hypothetical protein n=1 Tax=Streptomyces sp. NPDC101213 TaxID=3366130 RepID=UPI0038307F37